MILPPIHFVGEHWNAREWGAWCSCTPEWIITEWQRWQHMLAEGYDPLNESQRATYEVAHYGRHDRRQLGFEARQFPVQQVSGDDRIPQGWIVLLDSGLGRMLGGRHRCGPPVNGMVQWRDDEASYGFYRVCATGTAQPVVVGNG